MLKEMASSGAAKLIAACVCPIAGTAALTVTVPPVRQAIHRMTGPTQHAKPKLRHRAPQIAAGAPAGVRTALNCPSDTPIQFANYEIAPITDIDLQTRPIDAGSGGEESAVVIRRRRQTDPAFFARRDQSIPEPAAWLEMIIGFGVVGGATRASYQKGRSPTTLPPSA